MPTHAKFTTAWTITWPEFEDIRQEKISKIILPSYKNVVLRFRLEFSCSMERNDPRKFGISIFYEDGPLSSIGGCAFYYDPRKDTQKNVTSFGIGYYSKRGEGNHWPNYEDNDINTLKNKYGLDESDGLHYSITIVIPLTVFNYKAPKPEIEQRREWLTGTFICLKEVEEADFSDVRFVAGDGGTFYCHRIIVGKQSKALDTMLKNPKSDGEKSGTFTFPSLDTGSLNAILQYLYTLSYDLMVELSAPLIIEVADFSEQYGLKVLKEACVGQLWEIVTKNPNDAIGILRFADLHPDAKYLKDRAMSVIMENYEKLALELSDFSGGNENDLQGNRLKEEYVLYTMHSLWM